ncbi:dTDP-4-dehydrorhamnose 3,5-epimerase [Halomonas sp. McH1-25]|uniref:dTDP-4-dehydrorhamnose 3,5-epimerase n=1 Tax=unclassified Halomonas TaxID=2609666 RepID=UPI001EF454BA|nr:MULTISPECIES: dTDP-4-dehydrorhamnose 3,5-epimerase [unclassified Halomonas]MCG7601016.1 dTDP-4-dehydrorhamnose 3,5-epimerase [Halomonas sp. McH1-25]MCP1342107.1 dTDP-4-dehydrorhamnose 3,5-epimerase [Halomonas sp. FL8]MCP1360604.1 dTDP-4-dehydrorhamnose 3,5-epimerase [Halomonas sp. BBD45]MCP1364153.1 dTDP-4-dehydrorhamnose 3,5-epimerase [Halomonas sp. BBD48]
MIFHPTTLNDAWLIEVEPRGDERGYFARTMCQEEFAKHGLISQFVQQNTSFSSQRGTLRGLHYQQRPYGEAKLVKCLRGAIVDIIVDIREDSSTYLQHQIFELTDKNRYQLYVPPGFAHSFQTLTDDVEVSYLVSTAYHPEAERGLRYSDEGLGIDWPVPVTVISEKDNSWPLLADRSQPLY